MASKMDQRSVASSKLEVEKDPMARFLYDPVKTFSDFTVQESSEDVTLYVPSVDGDYNYYAPSQLLIKSSPMFAQDINEYGMIRLDPLLPGMPEIVSTYLQTVVPSPWLREVDASNCCALTAFSLKYRCVHLHSLCQQAFVVDIATIPVEDLKFLFEFLAGGYTATWVYHRLFSFIVTSFTFDDLNTLSLPWNVAADVFKERARLHETVKVVRRGSNEGATAAKLPIPLMAPVQANSPVQNNMKNLLKQSSKVSESVSTTVAEKSIEPEEEVDVGTRQPEKVENKCSYEDVRGEDLRIVEFDRHAATVGEHFVEEKDFGVHVDITKLPLADLTTTFSSFERAVSRITHCILNEAASKDVLAQLSGSESSKSGYVPISQITVLSLIGFLLETLALNDEQRGRLQVEIRKNLTNICSSARQFLRRAAVGPKSKKAKRSRPSPVDEAGSSSNYEPDQE